MLAHITDYLWEIKWWIDGADWRSWIAHSLIGIVAIAAFLALVKVYFLFPWIDHTEARAMAAATVAWGLREGEQLAFELMNDAEVHWLDHLMDIIAPVIVAGLVF